jgi:hypothetical protein
VKQTDRPYHEASPAEQARRVERCLRAAGWRPPREGPDPFGYDLVPAGAYNRGQRRRITEAPTDGLAPGERLGNDPRGWG